MQNILSFCEEGEKSGKPSAVFSEVQEKFANSLVNGNPEDQPFLYMKVVPVRKAGSNVAASIIPTACFDVKVKEEMINFINNKR